MRRSCRRSLQGGKAPEDNHHQVLLPRRYRGLPAGQDGHVGVLLRLPGPLCSLKRLRADANGHGQHVLRPLCREAGGRDQAPLAQRVREVEARLACLHPRRQAHPRPFQTQEAGQADDRPLFQVLLPGRWPRHRSQGVGEGGEPAAKPSTLGALRLCAPWGLRHGDQPGLPQAQQRHVHVRAAQAGPVGVLRQASGVAGRHPHRPAGVPHPGSTVVRLRDARGCMMHAAARCTRLRDARHPHHGCARGLPPTCHALGDEDA